MLPTLICQLFCVVRRWRNTSYITIAAATDAFNVPVC
ncbi:uncharacterized protein METZ01_LOCUS240964, partial [marine metagenome]